MIADVVEERLASTPFSPFTVHLNDGRFFHVDHPDFATLVRYDGRLVIHFTPERIAYLSLASIATIECLDREVSE